jgi:hypothetical protein
LEATPEYALRKTLVEFGKLAPLTVKNLVREEIQPTNGYPRLLHH